MNPLIMENISAILLGFALLCIMLFAAMETTLTGLKKEDIHEAKRANKTGIKSWIFNNMPYVFAKEKLILNIVLIKKHFLDGFAVAVITIDPNNEVLSKIVVISITLIIGEMLPKFLAMKKISSLFTVTSFFLVLYLKLITYGEMLASFAVTPFASVLKKLGFISASQKAIAHKHNNKELQTLIDIQHEEGKIAKLEKYMLDGLLDLEETEVRQVMTHKHDIMLLQTGDTILSIENAMMESGFSRFPVIDNVSKKGKDGLHNNIVGTLHIRDFFRLKNKVLEKNQGSTKLTNATCLYQALTKDILREPLFISSKSKLKHQLEEFQRKKKHLAIVVDEFEEMVGVVTLEDVLEEIVGDISDEHDIDDTSIVEQGDGSWIVDTDYLLHDFNRKMDIEIEDDDVTTVIGLVTNIIHKLPKAGDFCETHGYRFEVMSISGNQGKIKIRKIVQN